ncbi:glycosyltransferase family 4 protein [Calothrix sp. UHCC 0171]|uniref:glycosyltransferase family 4 protein n=1 Tax=Calothrix sp. UHCC 0171 TaxID=3110245 RepID=UPI002B20D041|nr:glycosyltransferase family 4 protein [Calothrix sp. UHCC 0171]MEA5573378.1 glycosyltransferase family 4 protein [Calothrix sp. UHCC 0171]
MHPLILSTFDISGGAAKAAFRLHQGLRKINIDSTMLVQYQESSENHIIGATNKLEKYLNQGRPTLDNLPLNRYQGQGYGTFSPQWVPDLTKSKIANLSPDIINLHWICGYIQIESIPRWNKPLVWTLHDMWTFTGGCQYSHNCDRYIKSCGACPQLHSDREKDISRWIWERKAKAWHNLDITIVTPSQWLANCTRTSSLFSQASIKVIPNGIDIQRYKPLSRTFARECLNLPQDKQLVLVGANSLYLQRKGADYLHKALESLQTRYTNKIELIVFGTLPSEIQRKFKLDLGFPIHYIGNLKDDISLALIYAASDVFIAPYIEDNLPNTIIEALACGTPCVAFAIGGIPEIIEHQKNGFLAQPLDAEELAVGIIWVLENNQRWQKLSQNARQKVEREYTQEIQAKSYLQLFTEIINNIPEALPKSR